MSSTVSVISAGTLLGYLGVAFFIGNFAIGEWQRHRKRTARIDHITRRAGRKR